ncbi:MAG: amidohydrolase family protein, partial [Bacteroidota bacterium]
MKTQNRNSLVSWLLLCIFMMGSLYAQTETKAIWAGQMVDVINAELIDDVIIVVEGGKIKNIVSAQKKDMFTDLINLSDYTVLPGLIDCHTHLTSPSFDPSIDVYELPIAAYGILGANYAKTTLLSGFTTVRDVGGTFYSDVALRDAINKGWAQGPRMYVSGKALTITGGHGAWANWLAPQLALHPNPGNPVDGEAEVRKATRELIKNGVDLIKINATGGFGTSNSIPGAASFTIGEMRAAVEEANKRGLKVAAHAHGADGIMNAVKAGVHSIEHGTFLNQESIDLMKKNKVYLVMDLLAAYVDLIEKNEDYSDKQLKKGNEEIYRDLEKTFFNAYSQGVLISFGTDASIFKHGRNAE